MSNTKTTLGLGTAAIGRPQYINIRDNQPEPFEHQRFYQRGIDILDKAYGAGIRYFDTAPGYGMAEQIMLDWIKTKEDQELEVATKWGYTYTAGFDANAEVHEVKEHSLDKLNEQWQQSRLLLPRLSTYQIHSATFESGVLENEEVLKRLHELKKQYGLIIGMTSTGDNQVEVLKKALDLEVEGEALFGAFQLTYNVFDQSGLDICREMASQGKRIIVKEAMANGRVFPNERYPHYGHAYQKLTELADMYEVGVDAIALRFCIDSFPLYSVLSGAAASDQLAENLKALDFQLSASDMEELKTVAVDPRLYWQERKQLEWN